ncbi:hypothetical protein RSAG8_08229, partial [Rhizoctonia solani AG-8 WAC10335]
MAVYLMDWMISALWLKLVATINTNTMINRYLILSPDNDHVHRHLILRFCHAHRLSRLHTQRNYGSRPNILDMNEEDAGIFAQGAVGLALAATALAEAAQSLSEAAAALSVVSQDAKLPSTIYQSLESATGTQASGSQEIDNEKDQAQEVDDDGSSEGANTGNNAHPRDVTSETPSNKGSFSHKLSSHT